MKILLTLFVLFFSTQSFAFLFGITSVENTTCEDIEKEAKGQVLKNLFGAEFTILKVKNSKEVSRTENKLVCLGDVKLDNGTESKLRMEIYEEDGQIWFNYQQEENLSITNNMTDGNNLLSKSTLKEKILDCKNMSNNSERLFCFDEMSKEIKTSDAIMIPSIEKLFAENTLQIGGLDKPFYGCLIDIQSTEDQYDLLTNEITVKGSIHEVTIGNIKNSIKALIYDFQKFSKSDDNAPQIGDCFAYILDYPITDQPGWGWANAIGKIYANNDYVVDDKVNAKTPKNVISVEEYFDDNIYNGLKDVQLTGMVESVTMENDINKNMDFRNSFNAVRFRLPSNDHVNTMINSYVIFAYFNSEIWKDNNLLTNKIKSIKEGDTLVLKGNFNNYHQFDTTHGFTITEILN